MPVWMLLSRAPKVPRRSCINITWSGMGQWMESLTIKMSYRTKLRVRRRWTCLPTRGVDFDKNRCECCISVRGTDPGMDFDDGNDDIKMADYIQYLECQTVYTTLRCTQRSISIVLRMECLASLYWGICASSGLLRRSRSAQLSVSAEVQAKISRMAFDHDRLLHGFAR